MTDQTPLTDDELANIRDNLAEADRSADPWEVVPNYRAVRILLDEVERLRAENVEIRTDASWLLDELGLDHWRGCDLGDENCYQCEGYLTTRDRINPERT